MDKAPYLAVSYTLLRHLKLTLATNSPGSLRFQVLKVEHQHQPVIPGVVQYAMQTQVQVFNLVSHLTPCLLPVVHFPASFPWGRCNACPTLDSALKLNFVCPPQEGWGLTHLQGRACASCVPRATPHATLRRHAPLLQLHHFRVARVAYMPYPFTLAPFFHSPFFIFN